MLGHSMGSYLLRQYITEYSDNLSGVILMGTGYISPCIVSMSLNFLKIFACSKGWHHRSIFLKKVTKYQKTWRNRVYRGGAMSFPIDN